MGNALCCIASCVIDEFWGDPRGVKPLVAESALVEDKARRLAPVEPVDLDDGVRAPPPPPVAIGEPIKDTDYYCGVNCYYLMVRGEGAGRPRQLLCPSAFAGRRPVALRGQRGCRSQQCAG
jgi:hypothetical protein